MDILKEHISELNIFFEIFLSIPFPFDSPTHTKLRNINVIRIF